MMFTVTRSGSAITMAGQAAFSDAMSEQMDRAFAQIENVRFSIVDEYNKLAHERDRLMRDRQELIAAHDEQLKASVKLVEERTRAESRCKGLVEERTRAESRCKELEEERTRAESRCKELEKEKLELVAGYKKRAQPLIDGLEKANIYIKELQEKLSNSEAGLGKDEIDSPVKGQTASAPRFDTGQTASAPDPAQDLFSHANRVEPTRQHKVLCHTCNSHIRTMEVANPLFWKKYKYDQLEVEGSYSSSSHTGEVRYVVIDGTRYTFLRSEVKEYWRELEALIKREDSNDI